MKVIIQRLLEIVYLRKPKGIHRMPPVLTVEDCPSISVITPTYNRRKLLDIAFNNMLTTDYPKEKIQWIIIEDHEDSTQMATDKVIKFQQACSAISIKYIPIQGRMSIGQKRNLAVDQADHDIVLFMDDDDHYPPTSFRRRVAWLLGGEKKGQKGFAKIACCTMLALYDLMTGVSAVNVPPMNLPLSQRVSEATFTFYKSAWLERKFKEVSIAEGEDWIAGREHEVIEIPCQQIIVAFSHTGNQSSRRVPVQTDRAPSCFWGFSREYLTFIHRLVGVEIEEDSTSLATSKRKK
jgi:glycosyltransferase involved in cell wall biosynthesis